MLILKMVLKVSDIGNVTKGQAYCLGWTERVVAEFFAQGDLEAELKLPVTPMLDRRTANVPKQQVSAARGGDVARSTASSRSPRKLAHLCPLVPTNTAHARP